MKRTLLLAATAALTFAQANWPMYSGAYNGWRHSQLDMINRDNVDKLKVAWVYQMPITERIETTPLVIDGIMYLTEPPSNVVALDAETGRPYWRYRRSLPCPSCRPSRQDWRGSLGHPGRRFQDRLQPDRRAPNR
jgi:glucose dehydrogenase